MTAEAEAPVTGVRSRAGGPGHGTGRAEHSETSVAGTKVEPVLLEGVLDRLVQQALHQSISPIFETRFSEHSYGFRPGRNAHQAVLAAQRKVLDGWVRRKLRCLLWRQWKRPHTR